MGRRSRFGMLVMVLAVSVGCGVGGNGEPPHGSGGGSEFPPVAKDPKLAALVPKAVAADGALSIANDQTYPPNEFVENGNVVGMDVDLGRAMAQRLGLTANYVNSSFDGILGGITANKYEAGMSSFSVNAERLHSVSMVSYFVAGTSMAVSRGNPDGLTVQDLCGKTIAVQKGSTQAEELQDRTKKCQAAGKPAVNMQQFQAQTDATLALNAKRAQGELADSPVISYAIKQTSGRIQQVGQRYANAPYGVVVGKNQLPLANAIRASIQSLIDDGTYARILDKWGVVDGGIKKSEVNPNVPEDA